MKYVTLKDRVPINNIERITNEALIAYLQRHGWEKVEDWTHKSGVGISTYQSGQVLVSVPVGHQFTDHVLRMIENIEAIVCAGNVRVAAVLDELTAIFETKELKS